MWGKKGRFGQNSSFSLIFPALIPLPRSPYPTEKPPFGGESLPNVNFLSFLARKLMKNAQMWGKKSRFGQNSSISCNFSAGR